MEHGTPAELTDVRKFISDLNLLRRHIQSYPAGHPIVEESLKRVFGKLHQIVVLGGSLVIGVAGSVLMVNDSPVESKEPAIRDFTRSLFGLGIMSITFRPDVTAEGLRALNQILMMGQDALQSSGGLQAILAAAPLQDIDIKTMDYGALSVQHGVLDDDASVQGDFWERFVRAVTRGAAAGASDLAGQSREVAEPEMLASLLAGLIEDKQWSASVPAMLGLLKRFLKEADEESYVHDPQALGKFVRFLHVLKPEVRDYFLQSSFDALSNRTVVAERILDGFSIELLGDALNKGMTSEGFAPPSIVAIMKRLARTKNIPVGEEKDGSQLAESLLDNESLERMQVVFQEEDRDKFVPQEYDETLRDLLESVKQSSPDEDDIEQLRTGLLEHSIDVKMSAIILEIIDAEIGGEHDSQSLGGDLMELCDGFIRVGDFRAVTDVFNRLKQFGDVSGRRHAMLATFSRPELIDEVLKTPEIWGKDKFKDIATFIKTVGLPFVEPMLDRLAVEEKMSLRRFYMDRIIDCGPNAVGAVSARLDDPRWYYVRNLIVILRGIGSSQAAPFLRNARHHTHARVRHELIKTFLEWKEPSGVEMLMEDLGSVDPQIQTAAFPLARLWPSAEVVARLEAIVEHGGLKPAEIEARQAASLSLATVGAPSSLGVFERVLRSKNLFRHSSLQIVKFGIIDALGQYTGTGARGLLSRIKSFGNKDLAQKAESVETSICEKTYAS